MQRRLQRALDGQAETQAGELYPYVRVPAGADTETQLRRIAMSENGSAAPDQDNDVLLGLDD